MTIHKQYYEYHSLKDLMYAQLKTISNLGLCAMIIGLVYLIFLTISLFLAAVVEPVAVLFSQAIVFGNDIGNELQEVKDSWTVVLYKITGFMCAIIFLILGSYISYHKSVVKVDAVKQTLTTATWCMWVFLVVGLIHTVFVTYFAIQEDIELADDQTKYTDLESKKTASVAIAISLQLIFFAGEFASFWIFQRKITTALATMIKFHDYLIEYRLTPRSRILRKHLPKMSMVIEEESNADQSSIMLSQSRMMSSHSHTRLMSQISRVTMQS